MLFDQMKRERLIDGFDREVKFLKKRVDFPITMHNKRHWIEIKHWLIGKQRGFSYNCAFYFGDPTSVGICKDVEFLRKVPQEDGSWLLIFTTTCPDTLDWSRGIAKYNEKFGNHLIVRTNPSDYDSSLGLIE